jgi:hypothetical protein
MKTIIYIVGKLAEAGERGKSAKKVIELRTSVNDENPDPIKGYVC